MLKRFRLEDEGFNQRTDSEHDVRLMSGKTIQSSDQDKIAPLLRSSQDGNLGEILELLHQEDSLEVANTKNKAFPLLYAAQNGRTKIVDALIGARAEVDLTQSKGFPIWDEV